MHERKTTTKNMDQKQLIRVDNWGNTTLKRMQQFFFHSKHCDLTLRFSNNTALKVHRLIMRMYTDYFDRLVAHYNSTESVMMPRTLQSDVALPIIKFFYTGSIEFDDHQLSALLQAAKLIRVPILVELLELHQERTHNRAKIVTKLTTLTEKKSIVHPLFANRDITVNVLDKKHKTMAQATDMSVVKKIKLCEKTGKKKKKKKKDGDTNITNDDSQMSDLISSAIRNGDAMDGPLRFPPQAKISTTSGTPFGHISYDNMVDNSSINEYASGDGNYNKNKIIVIWFT